MRRTWRTRATPKALTALVGLALPVLAAAHDLWIEPSGDGYALRYGHRGGERLPLDTGRLDSFRCRDDAAVTRDLLAGARVGAAEVSATGSCAAVSAALDGGFHSLTPDGEKPVPKDRAAQVVRAWASREFAKWIDVRAPGAAAPMGDTLEIVPVSDLARAKVGDKIAVRVLLDGKPASGASVAVDHRTLGETDSEGVLRLRLRGSGLQSVAASLRRHLGSPQADELVLEASLTFEVRP